MAGLSSGLQDVAVTRLNAAISSGVEGGEGVCDGVKNEACKTCLHYSRVGSRDEKQAPNPGNVSATSIH